MRTYEKKVSKHTAFEAEGVKAYGVTAGLVDLDHELFNRQVHLCRAADIYVVALDCVAPNPEEVPQE